MAHELEIIGGQGSFVSAREHAWHRLGTVLPGTFGAADAMTYAKLGGWNVRKEALTSTVLTEDGVSTLDVPGQYATVRTSPADGRPEVLGVVGEQYRPIQNEDHAELLDTLVDESGAHFETAGSLKGGRQVFLTMKMPETMTIAGTDKLGVYLAALNSHDGSSAFRLIVTMIRIVCANTQAAALRGAVSAFSIQHTSGAKAQIAAARQALGLTWRYTEAFQAEAERLIEQSMTDGQFVALTRELWPLDEKASARTQGNAERRELSLVQLFTEADTNANIRGTRWAGYQAITEYLDHFAPVDGKRNPADVRAERVVSGGEVTKTKNRAFALLSA